MARLGVMCLSAGADLDYTKDKGLLGVQRPVQSKRAIVLPGDGRLFRNKETHK
jgi:hypothetical protein